MTTIIRAKSLFGSLIGVLALMLVLAGTIAVVKSLATRFASISDHVFCIFICAPLLAELGAILMTAFQLRLYTKVSEVWSNKSSMNLPFLSLVGGAAAAQFVAEGLAKRKQFADVIGNVTMVTNCFFYCNLAAIICFVLYVGIRHSHRRPNW
jgi:hypothetical protein